MCSICYKEHLQRQQNSGRISPMGKGVCLWGLFCFLFTTFKIKCIQNDKESRNMSQANF